MYLNHPPNTFRTLANIPKKNLVVLCLPLKALTAWVGNIQFSCMCYLQWKLTSKLVLIKVAASNMENISNRLVIMISHTHSFSISQCSSFMSNSPPTPHNWCLLRRIRCQVSTACMLSKY